MKEGDKFFVNRMGYNQHIELEGKDIYEILGIITITITKVNKKTFRCDYNDKLYESIPDEWREYTKKSILGYAIILIADTFYKDSYYLKYAKKAYNLLDEEDKEKVKYRIRLLLDKKHKEARRKEYEKIINDTGEE